MAIGDLDPRESMMLGDQSLPQIPVVAPGIEPNPGALPVSPEIDAYLSAYASPAELAAYAPPPGAPEPTDPELAQLYAQQEAEMLAGISAPGAMPTQPGSVTMPQQTGQAAELADIAGRVTAPPQTLPAEVPVGGSVSLDAPGLDVGPEKQYMIARDRQGREIYKADITLGTAPTAEIDSTFGAFSKISAKAGDYRGVRAADKSAEYARSLVSMGIDPITALREAQGIYQFETGREKWEWHPNIQAAPPGRDFNMHEIQTANSLRDAGERLNSSKETKIDVKKSNEVMRALGNVMEMKRALESGESIERIAGGKAANEFLKASQKGTLTEADTVRGFNPSFGDSVMKLTGWLKGDGGSFSKQQIRDLMELATSEYDRYRETTLQSIRSMAVEHLGFVFNNDFTPNKSVWFGIANGSREALGLKPFKSEAQAILYKDTRGAEGDPDADTYGAYEHSPTLGGVTARGRPGPGKKAEGAQQQGTPAVAAPAPQGGNSGIGGLRKLFPESKKQ